MGVATGVIVFTGESNGSCEIEELTLPILGSMRPPQSAPTLGVHVHGRSEPNSWPLAVAGKPDLLGLDGATLFLWRNLSSAQLTCSSSKAARASVSQRLTTAQFKRAVTKQKLPTISPHKPPLKTPTWPIIAKTRSTAPQANGAYRNNSFHPLVVGNWLSVDYCHLNDRYLIDHCAIWSRPFFFPPPSTL